MGYGSGILPNLHQDTMTATPLLPREDFLRVLETIRANTNNPKILDATYQLEVLSASGPITTELWEEYGLTPTERKIFNQLATQRNKTFSRESLFNALYFDREEAEIKIIDVLICKIRNKLVMHDAPFWVETIWSTGYRLVDTPAREGKVPAHARGIKGLKARLAKKAA